MDSTNSISIQMFFNSFTYAYVLKSVTIENNNNIYMQNNTVEYNHWFYGTYKSLNINKNWIKKLKQEIFFLKVWAKNTGAHYTWENTVNETDRVEQTICHLQGNTAG